MMRARLISSHPHLQARRLRPDLILAGALSLTLAACGGGGGGAEVEARPQSVSLTATPSASVQANSTATVSATASSGLTVTYGSLTPDTCTVDTYSGRIAALSAGTCRITIDQSGDETYAPATSQTISLTVLPDPHQTLSFGPAPVLSLGGSASAHATSSSGLPVTYSSLSNTVCTIDAVSGELTALTPGTCVIAANQAGNTDILPATQVTLNLPVEIPSTMTVPGQPQVVTASVGSTMRSVIVKAASVSSGGMPITHYTVNSLPAGISADVSSLPATVNCPVTCAGYSFTLSAHNVLGQGTASAAAHVMARYSVITTFYEPDTQPHNSVFTGSFVFDATTGAVSGLSGTLTESMTGADTNPDHAPYFDMTLVQLNNQLSSIPDATLGGVLVTTFRNSNTNTFWTGAGGDGWTPAGGVAVGGIHYNFPRLSANPGNAYTMIFVNTSDPTTPLTQAQIDKVAYADCVPTATAGMRYGGGMMGAACMTGTSLAGYGAVGTMSGAPLSQVITRLPD